MHALANVGWVFLGGGIGSALRYGVGRVALAVIGPNFPAGTLAVNVIGCILMGAFIEWLALSDAGMDAPTRLFLTTGVLGGFTTFSAFSLDTVLMLQRGELSMAIIYVLASVIGSVAALFAGLALTRVVA